jgi:hypothetical protein
MISRGSILRWFLHRLSLSGETTARLPLVDELRAGLRVLPHQTQESIRRLAHAITGEAAELESQLAVLQEDLTPWVLSGVSRLEELLQNLLNCSRESLQAEVPPHQEVLPLPAPPAPASSPTR